MKFFGVETITGSKQMPNVPSALFHTNMKWGTIVAIPLSEIKKALKGMK